MADEYTRRVQLGMARHLHALGVGRYRDDGPYLPDDLGIYTGDDFPLNLDRALVIVVDRFVRTDGPASGFTPVQILGRLAQGERIDDLMDRLQNALDRRRPVVLPGSPGVPGIPLRRIEYRSGSAFSADSAGRRWSSQNFYLHGRRPS